jgi:ArsR family transcriptional regulator, arsenate/arsenite/antimonite-responsive transcriptional repressor
MTIELFKGLSEPIRLRIAILLLDQELCVCDLMAVLKLPQSTVSRHMSRMKGSGLVTDRRNGKWVHYQFDNTPLVNELRNFLRRNYAGSNPYSNDLKILKKYLTTRNCG